MKKIFLILFLLVYANGFAATSVTTRTSKGAALTYSEMDGNFTNLRDAIDGQAASLGASVASLVQSQTAGTIGFQTVSAMNADLAHPANTIALVTNDVTTTNNTYWIKLGASGSGSWQKSGIPSGIPWVHASLYADFATAVAAQGTLPRTLVISAAMPVTTAIAIPDTIQILRLSGGSLALSGSGAITGLREVEPELFGGYSDGTHATETTAAINAAIAAAPRIRFALGRTYLTNSISFAGLSGKYLFGGGTIKAAATGSALLALSSAANNIILDDLDLVGYGSGATDRGINLDTVYAITIKNCRIHGFNEVAILYGGVHSYVKQYPIEITGNSIYYNGSGVYVSNGEYANISRNKITLNGTRWSANSSSIDNFGGNAASIGNYSGWGIAGGLGNCRIDNNSIQENFYGVMLDGTLGSNSDHSSITGNQINHNQAYGLYVANLNVTEQIVNNEILSTVGPGVWTATGTSLSLILYNVHNLGFIGNTVDGGSANTVRLDSVIRSRFIGNNFYANANVTEATACNDNIWIGNDFSGNSTGVSRHSGTTRVYSVANLINNQAGDVPIAATFRGGSSWQDYDAANYKALSYWRGLDGKINIQGSIKSTNVLDVNTVIFNLPAGYRPAKMVDVVGTSLNTGILSALRVYPNGDVQMLSGDIGMININVQFAP